MKQICSLLFLQSYFTGAHYVFCRTKPEDTDHKTMIENYLPPGNIANLQVPKTNIEVWELCHKGVQIMDSGVQKIQHLQVVGLSTVLKLLDSVGGKIGDLNETQLQQLTDANRMACLAFSSMNQICKD